MIKTDGSVVMHVIYQLSVGGLENGLANIITRTQKNGIKHIVICLTHATSFKKRIPDDVIVIELNKSAGNDLSLYKKIFHLIKLYRPDVFHTRNLACIEYQIIAWFCRVQKRIHSDHGWDIDDPSGIKARPILIRRIFSSFISDYVVLSKDAEKYVTQKVHFNKSHLHRIVNGVDTQLFKPNAMNSSFNNNNELGDADFVVGTVSRLETIKGVKDIIPIAKMVVDRLKSLKVVFIIVGDGSLRSQMEELIISAGMNETIFLVGDSDSTELWYQLFDVFLLTSLAEGISNTILEAMASGLPVVATNVGGNSELVKCANNGYLFPVGDMNHFSNSIIEYALNNSLCTQHGTNSRKKAIEKFSIDRMITRYSSIYT